MFVISVLSGVGGAISQDQTFYKGKTVRLMVGFSAGGEYDLQARLVARHLARHIPGVPTIIAENMLGAGGLTMANYLYNVAAQDGTALGAMTNTLQLQQASQLPGVNYDALQFKWLGALSPTVETLAVWRSSKVRSIEQARKEEVVIGAVGRGGITYTFPAMLNEFAGTKFKIINGYPGGNDVNLAMQRGEVEGRNNTLSSWRATKPEWLANGDLHILVYGGTTDQLPGVPSAEDLAQGADEKAVITFLMSGARIGRPIAAAPKTPPDRTAILRTAFDRLATDPEFLKEAAALKVDVHIVPGQEIQSIIQRALAASPDVIARAKPLLN
jgi:tripartite-type tricarboxylate transporter receptor subunit TctC